MSKRVYISADYSEKNGDREVVDNFTDGERIINIKWII